ncbi:DUF4153 domain-containing protein [Tissierella sp. Yu-01]|uniref:DUF4153 domain-containing protein n=1 Tax=Tissierella sp. Yu-01 TaxID=3035694 RepID=UPI00240CEAFF|nr:DUF4153 domain-containing protein [Tissierella sp. Yu-01]WFA09384.1 DUF4153 domain-containing protein [Tissierella sp. Yu-01]
MRILSGIKHTLINIKKSIERFPVTIVLSVLFTILLIYNIEVSRQISHDTSERLMRLNMVLGLGLPMSLFIGLLSERLFKEKKYSLAVYLLSGVLLVLYYKFLLPEFEMVSMTRFFGTMLFFIISCFYALKIKHDINYETFVIKVFSSIFITILYSAVLFIGLTAILFTIENLFEVNLLNNIYLYMFFIVVFIFGVPLFLSKVPEKDEDFIDYEYSKSLKVLLLYIVIPLITTYSIILYAYFIKILITWSWPKGLVSHLVLWYSVISVGVIFFINPILEENKLAKGFKFWFPKFILPIMAMMFISIWQRIEQYGITENRYYVIVLGFWVFGIMLYFTFMKPLRNIIIPISLSIVVLLSIYGPISSYSMSKASQNNRLERILEENNMLNNGVITSNTNLDSQVQNEISNIISYFYRNHSLEDIKVFPNDYEVEDTKELLGFDYSPYINIYDNMKYFNYYLNLNGIALDVKGYEYYVNMSSWKDELITIDDMSIDIKRYNHMLNIFEEDNTLISVDIKELAEEIHNNSTDKSLDKNMKSVDNMTFNIGNDKVKVRIVFTNLSGRINVSNNGMELQSAEFILLIHKEN